MWSAVGGRVNRYKNFENQVIIFMLNTPLASSTSILALSLEEQ